MIEEDIRTIQKTLAVMQITLNEIRGYIIPQIKDYKEQSNKAKKLVKKGKKPRKKFDNVRGF